MWCAELTSLRAAHVPQKEALTEAAKATTKALFSVKGAVAALDGVALLAALKALRLSIVQLVKSARDANKYTADVHACIVAVDATSKLAYRALSAPVIKTVAIRSGASRAAKRMRKE